MSRNSSRTEYDRRLSSGPAILLFALALSGCDKTPQRAVDPPAATARQVGPDAPTPAPSTSGSTSSPSAAASVCPFDRWLAGTIGEANAFAKLSRNGDAIVGTYFYEKPGIDLALRGSIADRTFKLVERLGSKPTGELEGACSANGRLVGKWSSPDGKRTLPFSFAVPDHLTVATRRTKFKSKTKVPSDNWGDCEYELATPVVLGAASKEAEDRMASAFTVANKDLLDPTYEREARACDVNKDGFRLTYFNAGFSVERQDEAVLILQFSGGLNSVPSAHPSNYAGATVLNLDVKTGRPIELADVVTNEKKLLALTSGCSPEHLASDIEQASPAYLFLPRGIRVVGTSYGHAMAILTFGGPEISYRALLRDGLLKATAPNAADWAAAGPAPAGESACRVRWTTP